MLIFTIPIVEFEAFGNGQPVEVRIDGVARQLTCEEGVVCFTDDDGPQRRKVLDVKYPEPGGLVQFFCGDQDDGPGAARVFVFG
jgi:hypothetical protein